MPKCSHEPAPQTLLLLRYSRYRPTLVTGPRRPLILKLSDTRVYEPHIRARLGTAEDAETMTKCLPLTSPPKS